jgi:hypothetical protein
MGRSGEREPAKSFRELIVWQKAHELVLEIYRLSALFPKEEIYGLTSQLRRGGGRLGIRCLGLGIRE